MSAVRATIRRTIGRLFSRTSTAGACAGFASAAFALFAAELGHNEGGPLPLAVTCSLALSYVLPVLAAVLGMETWSEERATGRTDLLLSTAVREQAFVLGKFLGVWIVTTATMLVAAVLSLAILRFFSASAFAGEAALSFIPGLAALALQGALWCAVAVLCSSCVRSGAVAACCTVGLTVVLPRGLWLALMMLAPQGRTAFGAMPFDAQMLDMASGVVSTGTLVFYGVAIWTALFLTNQRVCGYRLEGRGWIRPRVSSAVASVLALAVMVLACEVGWQLDTALDLPFSNVTNAFSARTRGILAESSGDVVVSCFLPRDDVRFREATRFLRRLKREGDSLGGARIQLRFVDPQWDVGAAERLVRLGATPESIVFERGYRHVVMPLADGCDERFAAVGIRRVCSPMRSRPIGWTIGHGELDFADYGAFGMSDMARDLTREGYRNVPIDMTSSKEIPSECALLIVAGARMDFSRAELGQIDAYLKRGGRLLVLTSSAENCGVTPLLPAWGLRPAVVPFVGRRTLSGTDAIVSDLKDHAITLPLKGSRLVLEKPVSFLPSAVAEVGTGADRIVFSPLATIGSDAMAAATERGVGAGRDLAIRPTRIVAVGDADFVTNGQLVSRANANRDFFLNCISYLAGTEISGSRQSAQARHETGMDRLTRARFTLFGAGVLPLGLFLILLIFARRGRFRV